MVRFLGYPKLQELEYLVSSVIVIVLHSGHKPGRWVQASTHFWAITHSVSLAKNASWNLPSGPSGVFHVETLLWIQDTDTQISKYDVAADQNPQYNLERFENLQVDVHPTIHMEKIIGFDSSTKYI